MKDKTLDAYVDGRRKFLEIENKLALNDPRYVAGPSRISDISGIRKQLEDGLRSPKREVKVKYLFCDKPLPLPGHIDPFYGQSNLKIEVFVKI